MNKKTLFALTAAFLLTALPARAAILPECAKDVNAVLQLSCFLNLLIGVSQFILGLTGSLALLFFVYGGFLFLTSGGKSDQITKGKTILTQATIGIIIIFGAYLAINFLVANVLKAKFTTEIPKEATPITSPITSPTSNAPAPACANCTCATQTDTKKLTTPYNSEAECSAACKKEGWENGGCGLVAPKQPTDTCRCFCKQKGGVSGFVPKGDSPSESECQNTCQNAGLILMECRK